MAFKGEDLKLLVQTGQVAKETGFSNSLVQKVAKDLGLTGKGGLSEEDAVKLKTELKNNHNKQGPRNQKRKQKKPHEEKQVAKPMGLRATLRHLVELIRKDESVQRIIVERADGQLQARVTFSHEEVIS